MFQKSPIFSPPLPLDLTENLFYDMSNLIKPYLLWVRVSGWELPSSCWQFNPRGPKMTAPSV